MSKFLAPFFLVSVLPWTACSEPDGAKQKAFSAMWYDGKAEIATYKIKEQRYKEAREGMRTLVFVTEPLAIASGIKPDKALTDNEQVPVLKMNDVRQFETGIYQYNIMTSVFQTLAARPNIPNGSALKVSFSGQEWCGQVFERMIRKSQNYEGMLYSYFDSEGEQSYTLPHNQVAMPEENLWISIRELQQPWLKEGETKKLTLIPSVWNRRKSHTPPRMVPASITKEKTETLKTALGEMKAVVWKWEVENGNTTVWVEEKWPHRILAFREADGSEGRLFAVNRQTYWQENKSTDINLRAKFGLPSYGKAP